MSAAREALRLNFGHDAFMPLQEEVIERTVGGEDSLVIMPTGGGKSICYQLPALMRPGLTVVLSPLIALMQDQVDALQKKGIAATFINSSLDRDEREERLQGAVNGDYRLLYVTPERFRKTAFREALSRVEIALLAVDEAHCISSWGHDFRPDYGKVGRIRDFLGEPPTIALTATATPETQKDILHRLGIEDAHVFHAGIERPNLFVGVRRVFDDAERVERLVEVARSFRGPGIIYFALIRDLHRVEDHVRRAGLEPIVYHGGLSADERRKAQRRFLKADRGVVLATNAFGMGVDKPNIRYVIHAQIPGSIEAYYQEIGRAGRDGDPSYCEVIYLEEDLMIQKQFADWGNPSAEFLRRTYDLMVGRGDDLYAWNLDDLRRALLAKNRHDGRPETVLGLLRSDGIVDGTFEQGDLRIVRPLRDGEEQEIIDGEKNGRDLRRLLEVVHFANDEMCRRRRLHRYFGFEEGEDCGVCDRCVDVDDWLSKAPVLMEAIDKDDGNPVEAEPDDAPVKRGDWLALYGRRQVLVRRVERLGKSWRAEVEDAVSLEIKTIDLDRARWKRIGD